MAEVKHESNAIGAFLGDVIKGIFSAIGELLGFIWPLVKVAVSFILWVFAACIILPCVWIALIIYPLWEKWGEQF